MWANLGEIKEMYSNEVYNIIISVIILWLWNMEWWVSELKGGPDPLDPHPPDLPLTIILATK